MAKSPIQKFLNQFTPTVDAGGQLVYAKIPAQGLLDAIAKSDPAATPGDDSIPPARKRKKKKSPSGKRSHSKKSSPESGGVVAEG